MKQKIVYISIIIFFKAGTKDFPTDHIDDLKPPFNYTLHKTKRGRDADAYYRSHHETDTVIGHPLGAAVALSLENNIKKNVTTHMESFNLNHSVVQLFQGKYQIHYLKNIINDEIITAGAAGGLAIGTSADAAIGFSDGGLLKGLGADIGKRISSDFANRITEDTNTSPDRIKYFGDPVSMFDFISTTVMPSMGFRWKNSAHSYKGLFIKDAAPLHDVEQNPLTPSPEDSKAEIITE